VLTIKGYGFNSTNITTTVDGVACSLISSSLESFDCKLSEASAVSDLTKKHLGQNGVRKHLVLGTSSNPVYISNIEDDKDDWVRNESLALNLESVHDINENYYGNHF